MVHLPSVPWALWDQEASLAKRHYLRWSKVLTYLQHCVWSKTFRHWPFFKKNLLTLYSLHLSFFPLYLGENSEFATKRQESFHLRQHESFVPSPNHFMAEVKPPQLGKRSSFHDWRWHPHTTRLKMSKHRSRHQMMPSTASAYKDQQPFSWVKIITTPTTMLQNQL